MWTCSLVIIQLNFISFSLLKSKTPNWTIDPIIVTMHLHPDSFVTMLHCWMGQTAHVIAEFSLRHRCPTWVALWLAVHCHDDGINNMSRRSRESQREGEMSRQHLARRKALFPKCWTRSTLTVHTDKALVAGQNLIRLLKLALLTTSSKRKTLRGLIMMFWISFNLG